MKHKVNKTLPRSQHNRKKLKAIIGAIIGAIATFCTISGFSGVYVCEYISGGGEGSSDSGEGSSDSGEGSSDSGEGSSDSGEGSSDSDESSSDSDESSFDSGENISDSEVNEGSGTKDPSTTSDSSGPGEPTEIVVSSSTGESPAPDESSTKDDSTKPSIPLGESSSSNESPPEECKIFLYSEYSKITIYGENNMTATLNFEADEVAITAYLASGKVDTLTMNRKNSTEWGKKVIFNETGIHKIVATAIAPNGRVIEGAIEIEVIPVNLGDYNFGQLFPFN